MKAVVASSFLILSLFFTSSISHAESRTVMYPIQNVLDASISTQEARVVQFTVNTTYPNGCFTASNTLATLNYQQRSIMLTHTALKTDGECTQALVHVYPTADLKRPESGTYRVWDEASTRYLGALIVTNQGVEFERSQSDPELIIKEGGNYL